MNIRIIVPALFSLITFYANAQVWEPKKAVLMSRFSKEVDVRNVLPEYPRPQLVRQQWINLNGLWQFAVQTTQNRAFPTGTLPSKILVPFPVESPLSGIKELHDKLWYKRFFTIPSNWKDKRILLHFGAVDYESEVFINGKSLGLHKGGYDPFTFDITKAINKTNRQEIVVRVYDPTDSAGIARGKQTLNPQNIMYTSVTGIWQTAWLEPVPATSIGSLQMVPDIDRSLLKIVVITEGASTGYSVEVKVKDGGKTIQAKTGKANVELEIPVPKAKLWSPTSPFLYDVAVSLKKGRKTVDSVSSYFGMRKISIEDEHGYKKLFLNNKFLFQLGPLDQGFWPDGGYTAPTDKALKYDLEMIKALGFNMVRKHIKVEPYRWYYWAEKLGLMVWQDMPSINSYTRRKQPIDTSAYKTELTRLVKTHMNSPAIVMWVIFNESQGQHNTESLVAMVRALDPSRLINQASGGEHYGVGDVLDVHSYPAPAVPASAAQALACGEFGGIGYKIKDHIWSDGFGYMMAEDSKTYVHLYDSLTRDLIGFKTSMGLSAAVYTQITDVETELNGMLTYDRLVKPDTAIISAINRRVIEDKNYIHPVLPSSQKVGRTWKYTFDRPDSTSWFAPNYQDTSWKLGEAGFGAPVTFGGAVRTKWDTTDIWMRQEFELKDLSAIDLKYRVLYVQNDDSCEVYINGEKAADLSRHNDGYVRVPINEKAKAALKGNSKNIIAIHCRQISGGQFIDAGLYEFKL